MSWTLCTSGQAILKAGANANSTIVASGASLALWSTEAEGRICAETHTDFVTNYSSYNSQIQGALQEAASSLIGIKIINYDMGGYTSRQEATTMLDVNNDTYNNCIKILSQKELQRLS